MSILQVSVVLVLMASCNDKSQGDQAIDPVLDSPPYPTTLPPVDSILGALAQLYIVYPEPVIGADLVGNYSISGPGQGSLEITSVSLVNHMTYRLSFSGAIANGTLSITVDSVTGSAGGRLSNFPLTFSIDTVSPTQTANPVSGTILNALPQIDVTYSTPVTGADILANYTLSGPGKGSLAISAVSNLSGNACRLTLTGTPSDGAISVLIDNVQDAVKPLAGNSIDYTADVTPPTQTPTPASGTRFNQLSDIELAYSEQVVGASTVGNYVVSGTGKGSLAITGVSVAGSSATLSLSGTPTNGSILIDINNVTDVVGNALSSTAVNFAGDIIAPTQTASPPSGSGIASLPQVGILYDEPVVGADTPSNYVLSGSGKGSLAITGVVVAGNLYTLTLSGAPTNGTIQIAITNVTDLAGNTFSGAAIDFTYVGAGWHFVETSASAGLSFVHGYTDVAATFENMVKSMSGGVAAGDYDNDGDIDLYAVGGNNGLNHFFRNLGNGAFEDVILSVGIGQSGRNESGPAFTDYDGDSDLDLIIGGIGDGAGTPTNTTLRILNNEGGVYVDVTPAAGLNLPGDIDNYSVTTGDINGDQYPDLFLTHWFRTDGLVSSHGDKFLWLNNQDGTFSDATASYGLTGLEYTFTATFAHLNSDSHVDLLIAGDFQNEKAYLNNAGASLSDASSPLNGNNAMGSAVADFDNDGDNDWFVSHIYWPSQEPLYDGNRLYQNDGNGNFTEISLTAGVRDGGWGWAACAADFNNDTFTDIFQVNGMLIVPNVPQDNSRLFINNGDGTFTDKAELLGLIDSGQGRGVACFDAEGDGDIDIFVSNNSGSSAFYTNNLDVTNKYITIKLNGNAPNTEGLGSRVEVTLGSKVYIKDISNGSNFVSQNPAEAHFGLGTAAVIDTLKVYWADGASTTLSNVAVNQRLTIPHP